MGLDEYQDFVEELATTCATSDQAPQDVLERLFQGGDQKLLQAVKLRASLSNEVDAQRVEGLFETGLLAQFEREDRIGALMFCFEIGDTAEKRRFASRFARYKNDDSLFQFNPKLLADAREAELIPHGSLNAIYDDGTVQIEGGFAQLDEMLAPSIVHMLHEVFPDAKLFLRLDPRKAFKTRQPSLLLEAVMVPANPRWWRNLGLRKNQKTGARYVINAPATPSEDLASYIEFHACGFRKLETITLRREHNYLTMMLEELEQRSDQLLIGRCIHLDSEAPYDTTPAEAMVRHLDLAINVYSGSEVRARLDAEMNNADKVKTLVRTHLLRIEDAPIQILPLLCLMFFRSHQLRSDLISNQFIDIGDGGHGDRRTE